MKKIKPLLTKQQVTEAVKEVAKEINQDYKMIKEPILMLCVLKGAFLFYSDLVKKLKVPIVVDFVQLQSYGDKTTSDKVKFITKPTFSIKNKDVIIVEDIVDTGKTLKKLIAFLEREGAFSIRVCTLLDKECRREEDIPVHYYGFRIEDHFVIGYGLDFNEGFRNLSDIRELVDP